MADADALRDAGVTSRLPALTEPAPTPPPAPTPTPAAPQEEKVMTLVDHLSELRRRIFISIAAVALGSAVGFLYMGQLISILRGPLGSDEAGLPRRLIFLSPGEAFFVEVKLALVVGIVLAMPILIYELWAFISPGLTPQERRVARPWLPVALLFFAIGVTVAWVVLPYAIGFLLGFETKDITATITMDSYFGFVGTLFLAFGLTMEFPIVLVLLSKVGIITSDRLKRSRRIVILGIAVFSAVVTPGGDLVSPAVLGITMYLLYELAILLVKWGGR